MSYVTDQLFNYCLSKTKYLKNEVNEKKHVQKNVKTNTLALNIKKLCSVFPMFDYLHFH